MRCFGITSAVVAATLMRSSGDEDGRQRLLAEEVARPEPSRRPLPIPLETAPRVSHGARLNVQDAVGVSP
jgi:hypothetical protein